MELPNDRLWTKRELAYYTGYSETTIKKLLSTSPERLPPRVPNLNRARWSPSAVKDFYEHGKQSKIAYTRGRPRLTSTF